MIPKSVNTRPSSAHRWLACPGSAWVATACDAQPIDRTKEGKGILPPGRGSSPYAAEGTMAHAHLASFLSGNPIDDYLDDTDERIELPPDDIELVHKMGRIIQALQELDGYELHIETKNKIEFDVRLGPGTRRIHVIKGTADIVLVNDTEIVVLDYKHGAGIRVEVAGNPQLTLYGLMNLIKWPGRGLTIGVIQPRGVGKGIDVWRCSEEYIQSFKETVLAALVKIYDPFPAFNRGPWCQMCAGEDLGACPARLELALRYAVGIKGMEETQLSTAWWLLDYAESTKKVADKLFKEGEAFAKRGGKVPGWRLEKKSGNRRWNEPDEIAHILAKLASEPIGNFLGKQPKRKPIGIMDASKHPKFKGTNLLDPYIKRPTVEVLVRAEGELKLFDDLE